MSKATLATPRVAKLLRPKIAVDAFNQDLLKPTEHDLAANKRDGWQHPNIQGETERPLYGEDLRNQGLITSAIHEIPDPKVLPPRDDLRSHLSDEAQAQIDVAKGHTASLAKLAWSRSILTEVIKRWGKSPQMPKTPEGKLDEAALGAFLDNVEKLVPAGPKVKAYILYLCGQHFGVTPPAWQPGEDDAVIRPLMFNFDQLCTQGKLTGPQADLNGYKQLDQLKKAVAQAQGPEGEPEKPHNDDAVEAAMAPTDVKRTHYLPQDLAVIKANTQIVAETGGWACYKIPRNPNEQQTHAIQLLCNNGINKVGWCTGRGTTQYFTEGPFYVLVEGGRSRFAISSEQDENTATMWNPADTPVWVTTSGEGRTMPNLQDAATARGIPLDMTKVSSLPKQVIPILTAATQADPELAKLMPPTHLVEGDTGPLDSAIMATPIQGLVTDLAEAFSSERSLGTGAAVMGRCIQMYYDFSPEYSMFNENLLVGYIELLAAAGQKLPKTLEDAIIQAIQGASN